MKERQEDYRDWKISKNLKASDPKIFAGSKTVFAYTDERNLGMSDFCVTNE
jgi:hypothetical protein